MDELDAPVKDRNFPDDWVWGDLAKLAGLPIPTAETLPRVKEQLTTDKDLLLKVLGKSQSSHTWKIFRFLSKDLKQDRDVFLAAIAGSKDGWRTLMFAAQNVRSDLYICHEAASRNFAALELAAPELRQDGACLTEWLAMCNAKTQPKIDAKRQAFHTNWDKATANRRGSLRVSPKINLKSVVSTLAGIQLPKSEEEQGPRRVVPLAVCAITVNERCLLTQLGVYDTITDSFRVDLRLPGTKLLDDENPHDAALRMLKKQLPIMAAFIDVDPHFDAREEQEISASTGQHSRYLRSVFRCTLSPKCQWSAGCTFIPIRRGTTATITGTARSSRQPRLGRRFGTFHGEAPPQAPDLFVFLSHLNTNSTDLLIYAWMPTWEFEYLRYNNKGHSIAKEWMEQGDFSVLPKQKCAAPTETTHNLPIGEDVARSFVSALKDRVAAADAVPVQVHHPEDPADTDI